MTEYNAPSILGPKVRYVVSQNVFEKPSERLKFKSEEKTDETIKKRIDDLLRSLSNHMKINLLTEEMNKARQKFPFFEKVNIELFILAFYVNSVLGGTITDKYLYDIIVPQGSQHIIFSSLNEFLSGNDKDAMEKLRFDLNRYIERLNQ